MAGVPTKARRFFKFCQNCITILKLWEKKAVRELCSALQDSVCRHESPRQEEPAPLSANSEITSMPGTCQRWIALLGRRIDPTDDGVDNCTYPDATPRFRGYELEVVHLCPVWNEPWGAALTDLWRRAHPVMFRLR